MTLACLGYWDVGPEALCEFPSLGSIVVVGGPADAKIKEKTPVYVRVLMKDIGMKIVY